MISYFLCITQPSNLGDLIINKMLVMELSQYGKVFVDCKNTPREFADFLVEGGDNIIDTYKCGGITVKQGNLFKWSDFLKKEKIDIYVTSPGPFMYKENILKSLYFKTIHFALNALNIESYKIGNCCSQAISENRKIALPKNTIAYLRSKSSVELLQSKGENGFHFIPDLAFLLHQYVIPSEKSNIVAMSFRKVDNKDEFLVSLKTVISFLQNLNFNIEFYYQVDADKAFNEELCGMFDSERVSFLPKKIWYDSLSYYENKKFVVSNRLHSLITGAVYGALPIAIVNSESKVRKIEEVFECSFENYKYHIVESGSVPNLNYIVDKYKTLKESIEADVRRNCQLCKEVIANISSNY